jgi:hypothetical protein
LSFRFGNPCDDQPGHAQAGRCCCVRSHFTLYRLSPTRVAIVEAAYGWVDLARNVGREVYNLAYSTSPYPRSTLHAKGPTRWAPIS